jgi:uroporphyrin-3 C-methyltransferase
MSAEPASPVSADLSASDAPAGWMRWAIAVLSLATAGAGYLAWTVQKRVHTLEQELVRRQQDSQVQATEARVLARQAEDLSREAAARTTLLETRLSEVALQRTQVEDLIQTLSASRDENLVADIESGLRVATQQSTLTGSAEPLVVALQSADERLLRAKQPRLDNVRRAIAKDLDRVRATRVADLGSLTIRLDEAMRLVDEVPLLNQPETLLPPTARSEGNGKGRSAKAGVPGKTRAAAASEAASSATDDTSGWHWGHHVLGWTRDAAHTMWTETRALVRLTRVSQPDAMLISPQQGFFLRENIKLHLLNARVALLSRQTTLAQGDLQTIQEALPRYFDPSSRKTQLLQQMVAEVGAQSTQTAVPRPDDTLAALATVSGHSR